MSGIRPSIQPNRVIADMRDRKERSYDQQHGCEEGWTQIKADENGSKRNEKQGEATQKSGLR